MTVILKLSMCYNCHKGRVVRTEHTLVKISRMTSMCVARVRAMCRLQNLETARAVEAVVRQHGATPATIAILGGVPHIGLTGAELELLASRCPPYPALLHPDTTLALSALCMHELPSVACVTCLVCGFRMSSNQYSIKIW